MAGLVDVVAPAEGVFEPAPPTCCAEGEVVVAGDVIGVVSGVRKKVEVVCSHSGFVVELLAAGVPVEEGQTVAKVL